MDPEGNFTSEVTTLLGSGKCQRIKFTAFHAVTFEGHNPHLDVQLLLCLFFKKKSLHINLGPHSIMSFRLCQWQLSTVTKTFQYVQSLTPMDRTQDRPALCQMPFCYIRSWSRVRPQWISFENPTLHSRNLSEGKEEKAWPHLKCNFLCSLSPDIQGYWQEVTITRTAVMTG